MAVVKLDIHQCRSFMAGQTFGAVGPYQLLEGTVHFAVDPFHPCNTPITDITLAPRDSTGLVNFTAHFVMLQPSHQERGKHRILFDVVNRGRKTVLTNFNSASRLADPTAPMDPGNGFLMRQGYTIVWCGWQADVPAVPGLIGLQAPEALSPAGRLTGQILCQFQTDEQTPMLLLSDRQHCPHAAVDINDPSAVLLVRQHPNAPAHRIPREQWSFVQLAGDAEPYYVRLHTGFEPGKVYQLVYQTRGSTLVGLGFAAVRDIVSFLKYDSAATSNPCAGDIVHAYAFGASQSGRFLRHLIHLGLNEDEAGRMALDGIIPHVAGGMRGEFNLRFGQPSKDVCYIIPELFPFTDTPQRDPVTGRTGALLERLEAHNKVPKIMFTNTAAEYWRGDAALIHTDLAAMVDAPESASVRRYHFAGTQHGSGIFPPVDIRPADGMRGQLPFNSVDYTPLLRAALDNLDRWVSIGAPAPASKHPRLADGTAVAPGTLQAVFSVLPQVCFPPRLLHAIRLDYGPETGEGRTLTLPAIEGEQYPALVSAVDADGNETAGIRLPDITVPLATHTGWNLRHTDVGNPELLIGITGGLAGWTLPFPATPRQREVSADPRPAITTRYASKATYLQQVEAAAQALVQERYLLAEDVTRIVAGAAQKYDLFCQQASQG